MGLVRSLGVRCRWVMSEMSEVTRYGLVRCRWVMSEMSEVTRYGLVRVM